MSKQFKLGVITVQDISPLSKSKLPHPTVMGNDVSGVVSPVHDHDQYQYHDGFDVMERFDEHTAAPMASTGGAATVHDSRSESYYMNLGDLPVDASISDFWREVKSSVDDMEVTTSTSTVTVDDELKMLSQENEAQYTSSDTSLEDFLNHEDLVNDIAIPAQEVKLLCLRDSKGKFTLKTNRKKIKKEKKLKMKKSKVIRRKSGVCAMISTGIGINEFML